jgi:hypothetical protein
MTLIYDPSWNVVGILKTSSFLWHKYFEVLHSEKTMKKISIVCLTFGEKRGRM